MTTTAKGKQNDYERVYNAVGKIQDEEPERLQMTNHGRPPEIDDERTIIIEIFPSLMAKNSKIGLLIIRLDKRKNKLKKQMRLW